MNISDDYGPEFFAMHEPWRADYDAVADALDRHLIFNTVLDLGCGNGFIVGRLEQLGKSVRGIDGSEHAAAFNPKVEVRDLTVPFFDGFYDLVICTEVGEHLAPEHAETLVSNIFMASRDLVFFSAAAPGAGGHMHLNEQDKPYWREKFARFGFREDEQTTAAICGDISLLPNTWWFAAHAMVLRRI